MGIGIETEPDLPVTLLEAQCKSVSTEGQKPRIW
jgi:hypothetical protein